jgi:hypothetical protein
MDVGGRLPNPFPEDVPLPENLVVKSIELRADAGTLSNALEGAQGGVRSVHEFRAGLHYFLRRRFLIDGGFFFPPRGSPENPLNPAPAGRTLRRNPLRGGESFARGRRDHGRRCGGARRGRTSGIRGAR